MQTCATLTDYVLEFFGPKLMETAASLTPVYADELDIGPLVSSDVFTRGILTCEDPVLTATSNPAAALQLDKPQLALVDEALTSLGPVHGSQIDGIFDRIVSDDSEDFPQVGFDIEFEHLARSHEGIQNGGIVRRRLTACEHPVLSTEGYSTQGVFAQIVVHSKSPT